MTKVCEQETSDVLITIVAQNSSEIYWRESNDISVKSFYFFSNKTKNDKLVLWICVQQGRFFASSLIKVFRQCSALAIPIKNTYFLQKLVDIRKESNGKLIYFYAETINYCSECKFWKYPKSYPVHFRKCNF